MSFFSRLRESSASREDDQQQQGENEADQGNNKISNVFSGLLSKRLSKKSESPTTSDPSLAGKPDPDMSSEEKPAFSWKCAPVEIEVKEDNVVYEAPATEANGFVSQKCTVIFTKTSVDNDKKSGEQSVALGDLNIVVRVKCVRPKPGKYVINLNNFAITGFGPANWTVTAFSGDSEVFKKQGVTTAADGEDVNLGNLKISLTN